jgi:hypothetical protein
MPSDFIVGIEIDVTIPDFMDASVPMGQIANKVADDSRRNIRQQTNVDGSVMRRLSVKTIKDKRRKGSQYPNLALYRTGAMFNAIHVYSKGKNDFEVGIIPRGSPSRDLVALIHAEQGANEHTRVIRTFLGMTSATKNWSNSRIERWLSERVQKASRKLINLTY